MNPITQIDNSLLLFPEGISGRDKMLETEGFDFVGYLLGLQNPQNTLPNFAAELPNSDSPTNGEEGNWRTRVVYGNQDEALLALFSDGKNVEAQNGLSKGVLSPMPSALVQILSSAKTQVATEAKAEQPLDLAAAPAAPFQSLAVRQGPVAEKGLDGVKASPLPHASAQALSALNASETATENLVPAHSHAAHHRSGVSTGPDYGLWLASRSAPRNDSAAPSFGVSAEKFSHDAIGKYQQVSEPEAEAQSATFPKVASEHSEPRLGKASEMTARTSTDASGEVPKVESKKRGVERSQGRVGASGFEMLSQVTENLSPRESETSIATHAPEARTTVPELFDRVETMVHHGGGKMTVRLSPPELGTVEVQVTARGKRVEIEMRSENSQTKSILEQSLSDLKTAMMEQDLVLSKVEVQITRESTPNQEMANQPLAQGQSFAHTGLGSGQREMGQPHQNTQSSRHVQPVSLRGISSTASASPVLRTHSSGNGRVDLRI